jgi:hypothetical protein
LRYALLRFVDGKDEGSEESCRAARLISEHRVSALGCRATFLAGRLRRCGVPKRSPKLPFASADGEPDLAISDVDWQRIEGAYGLKLPPDVRTAVLEATLTFRYFEVFERTAEPVADAKAIIDACQKGASEFRRTLLVNAFKSSDASVLATYLIQKNFPRLLDTLGGLLTSLGVACKAAIKDLNDAAKPSHNVGDMWKSWIWRLTQIMRSNKLDWKVRKDTGNKNKSGKESPFTLFVWELQSCLPVECRRYAHSPGGLADAISEARKTVNLAIAKRQNRGRKGQRHA